MRPEATLDERVRMIGRLFLGRPWGLIVPVVALLAMYGVGVGRGRDG